MPITPLRGQFCMPVHILPAARIDEPVFAPLIVRDEIAASAEPERPRAEAPVRVVRGSIVIELAQNGPAARIAEIVHALEAHPS